MTYQTTPLNGGLDLITSPVEVTAGRIVDCYNYEVARVRGYRRMDGYEPFDGGPSPSAYRFVKVEASSSSTFFPVTIGDAWYAFQGDGAGNRVASPIYILTVVAPANPPTNDTYYLVYTGYALNSPTGQPYALPQIDLDAINLFGGGFADSPIGGYTPGFELALASSGLDTTNQANLTALTAFSSAILPTIQQVPGQGSVNGLFWLKNKLYATRDYFAINFTAGNT